MKTRRTRRIVCYAVNGAGLGHVTRLVAVGRWLRRYVTLLDGDPPEVLFLTSSESTEVLDRAGFPSFKVPSKTVVRASGGDVAEFKRLARHFVWHMLGTFSPDLLVVDTFPAGSFDELFQLLDGPFSKGLIHREVKPEFGSRPLFQAALQMYDTVVVPHGTASGAGDPSGEVLQVEANELESRDTLRIELGVPPEAQLVYVSAGGGGDPEAEAQLHMLVAGLSEAPDLHLLVGAGPLYRGPRLTGPRLHFVDGPGVVRWFPACDAAVSAAGYNTFHELLYLRVPSAFYAQPKVADDQAARIDAAHAVGACERLHELSDALATVRRVLARADDLRAACPQVIEDNGARRCARLLLRPRYSPERLAWAAAALDPEVAAAIDRSPRGPELLGRLLPRLVPPEAASVFAERPELGALLSQVSEAAAAEVRAALTTGPQFDAAQAFRAAFLRFVDAGAPTTLLESALKKHPLRQETGSRTDWLVGVLDFVVELTAREPRQQQAYKVFPRLVDCDAASAFCAFQSWYAAQSADDDPLTTLRLLKLTHRRITRAQVAP